MFLQVLLCFGGFVQANVDVGEIPYENPVVSPVSTASPPPRSSIPEYGNIPYEKESAKEDYGNIPYEGGAVVLKPRVDVDYGNIPYEKVLGLTTLAGNTSMNIPDIIQGILSGHDVEGLSVPTPSRSTPVSVKPRVSSEVPTAKEDLTSIEMRAKSTDADFIDYQSPGTIDDSDCRDEPWKKKTCSTCRDKRGYRVYCLNGTTTAAPSDMNLILHILVNIADVYWSNGNLLLFSNFNKALHDGYPGGWPVCPTTTTTTDTPSPTWAPHKLTGRLISKCFVCGMFAGGIPEQDHRCSDSFLSHSYKTHCKFLNRDGWHVNGSANFYMWGRWSGGCVLRYTDVTPIYHQRSCRNNVVPAVGSHIISRRMARLEFALRKEKDACLSSPTASLIPLSRGISLFARFYVCVCSTNYCNRAVRLSTVLHWYIALFTVIQRFCV